MEYFQDEIKNKKRFEFGKNWKDFLKNIGDVHIEMSKKDLLGMLRVSNLKGKTFLDVGSGSGLSSLSASKSGAKVTSFDFDNQSVECTKVLKGKFCSSEDEWNVKQGSVLDAFFMKNLGVFDVVYSWGVLHHTGAMYEALENVDLCVKKGGVLFISLYNDQGNISKIWVRIKKMYVKSPFLLKKIILFFCCIGLWGPIAIRDFVQLKPFSTWKNYRRKRGMSAKHDLVDWVGGYPFEVSKPEEIIRFYLDKGYLLKNITTCGGKMGCNQFVFEKI